MNEICTTAMPTHSELRRFWPVVLACFATASFCWGFGFTGPSIYLAELYRLYRLRGSPSATIASAVTVYYSIGAILLTHVHIVLGRLGPTRLLSISAVLLGLGASAFCGAGIPDPWPCLPRWPSPRRSD